jgi:hypothetical protein
MLLLSRATSIVSSIVVAVIVALFVIVIVAILLVAWIFEGSAACRWLRRLIFLTEVKEINGHRSLDTVWQKKTYSLLMISSNLFISIGWEKGIFKMMLQIFSKTEQTRMNSRYKSSMIVHENDFRLITIEGRTGRLKQMLVAN